MICLRTLSATNCPRKEGWLLFGGWRPDLRVWGSLLSVGDDSCGWRRRGCLRGVWNACGVMFLAMRNGV